MNILNYFNKFTSETFLGMKAVLTEEQKTQLALFFIDSEIAMYEYEGDEHPANSLHKFTYGLFGKDTSELALFINALAKLYDEHCDSSDFESEDFDFGKFALSKLRKAYLSLECSS